MPFVLSHFRSNNSSAPSNKDVESVKSLDSTGKLLFLWWFVRKNLEFVVSGLGVWSDELFHNFFTF